MKKNKSIHFVGIKGVGMTPLALIARDAGFKVSGSDVSEEFITDSVLKKAKIKIFPNFSKENIKNVNLVVTTGAHGGFENMEVKEAKEKGIKVITQGEAVGLFMNGNIFGRCFDGISIAGTHGKTTTTAMIATILSKSRQDPSFLIGTSSVDSLKAPGHLGKGKYFIAEADEYATEPIFDKTAKFLWQHPKIAVFTNIDYDHPDLYKSIDEVREVFLQFAKQLPSDGILIVNGDDHQIQRLLKDYNGKVIKYGMSPQNDFIVKKINFSSSMFFWVDAYGTSLGEFKLNIAGEHNALNALSAAIVSLECGLNIEEIKRNLIQFKGSKRRAEYIGKLKSGALLFDDYAHHPMEIKKTLSAFRQLFPKSKIICIFQPHTYSRTKTLFEEFIHSFSNCDSVLVSNIYPSLREKIDPSISSKLLVEGIAKFHKKVLFLPCLNDVIKYVKNEDYTQDNVIITMGAGDIYKIWNSILN